MNDSSSPLVEQKSGEESKVAEGNATFPFAFEVTVHTMS